jgi:electron transport complex protein RnfG
VNETLKLALVLFLITAISATILAVSNDITAPRIAEADALKDTQAKAEILPDGKEFKPLDENKLNEIKSNDKSVLEIFEAYSGDSIVGYTIKTLVNGYGGEIEFMTGISTEGKITGIKILNHGETPGLGANATKAYFTESFRNKSLDGEITASKNPSGDTEVQALTSATRTTDAILDGVNTARKIYNERLAN